MKCFKYSNHFSNQRNLVGQCYIHFHADLGSWSVINLSRFLHSFWLALVPSRCSMLFLRLVAYDPPTGRLGRSVTQRAQQGPLFWCCTRSYTKFTKNETGARGMMKRSDRECCCHCPRASAGPVNRSCPPFVLADSPSQGCSFLCVFGFPGEKAPDEVTHALESAVDIFDFCSQVPKIQWVLTLVPSYGPWSLTLLWDMGVGAWDKDQGSRWELFLTGCPPTCIPSPNAPAERADPAVPQWDRDGKGKVEKEHPWKANLGQVSKRTWRGISLYFRLLLGRGQTPNVKLEPWVGF